MNFLVRRFIKNYQDTKDANVRTSVGKLSGIVGIFSNLFLFVIKFVIGTIVHSVSIQADGVNNLTDAGSNIISILSFHLANNCQQIRIIHLVMKERKQSHHYLWEYCFSFRF